MTKAEEEEEEKETNVQLLFKSKHFCAINAHWNAIRLNCNRHANIESSSLTNRTIQKESERMEMREKKETNAAKKV